jgi:predicted nucleotidyltransferase
MTAGPVLGAIDIRLPEDSCGKLTSAMSLSALTPQQYHARREQALREERESLRREVLDQARSAIGRLAPRFPSIRAAYLFGSILAPGRFHPESDVDVAIDNDDLTTETPFWRALEDELRRNVDLRPRQGAVARAVEDSGERCYERKVPDSGA